jgi:hypothetical protein
MVDAAAGADVGADVAGSASVGGAAEASVVTAADYVPKQGDSVQVWLPGLLVCAAGWRKPEVTSGSESGS